MLATGGDHTIAEIAEVVCRAKSAVQKWLENWREEDLKDCLSEAKHTARSDIECPGNRVIERETRGRSEPECGADTAVVTRADR